jgi:hypothetical protein
MWMSNLLSPIGIFENQTVVFMVKDGEIITTNEGDVATSRAQGMGKLDKDGVARWLGSIFHTSTPTGKLTFLNNLIGGI